MYEGKENFIKTFGSGEEADMSAYLTVKDGAARWVRVELAGAEIMELNEGPMTLASTAAALNLNVDEDALNSVGLCDEPNSSHAVLRDRIGGKNYLLSISGRRDLFDRAGASCPLMSKVPDSTAFEFVNKGLPYLKGKQVKMKLEDDKLWCCHGDKYAILPISELFDCVKGASLGFKNPKFIGGSYTHEFVQARWVCDDDKVSEAYKEYAFEASGNIYDQFYPVIYFSSSDVGDSCAVCHAELSDGKRFIQIGPPIRMRHTGGASVDKFRESLDGLYAIYKKGMKNLESLYEIEIEYPLNCAMNIAHSLNMSVPSMKTAIETFGDMFKNNQSLTAAEVFFLLQEGLYLQDTGKNNARTNKTFSLQVRESLTRVLAKGFKWEEYDSPTIFKEK